MNALPKPSYTSGQLLEQLDGYSFEIISTTTIGCYSMRRIITVHPTPKIFDRAQALEAQEAALDIFRSGGSMEVDQIKW